MFSLDLRLCAALLVLPATAAFVPRLLSRLRSPGAALQAAARSTSTPMPREVHATLDRAAVGAGGRVVVVGDVHGCFDELQLLLAKVEYRAGTDAVVLVGDLVNKGPKSAEVVRWARAHATATVRGNHDDALLEASLCVGRNAGQDRDAALRGRYAYVHDLSAAELEWLAELPFTVSVPWLNLLVVHAGIVPGVPLAEQDLRTMFVLRNLVRGEGGASWEAKEQPHDGVKWVDAWRGPEHIVFGHDARRGLQQAPFATGLDTGACYGGSLTALVVAADGAREIVAVDALEAYAAKAGR